MRKENVFILFLALILISSGSPYKEGVIQDVNSQMGNRSDSDQESMEKNYSPASHATKTGVLNPLKIEHNGWHMSGTLDARTDTGKNLVYDLPLDTTHDWVGSKVEVDVWNLSRYYATNGTFNDGIAGTNVDPNGHVSYYPYGWDSFSYSPDSDQTQRSSYIGSGRKYVTVENEGAYSEPTYQNEYLHYAGSNVIWNQNISRVPYVEDFNLSFDFQYFRGPIGENVTGNCSIFVAINGTQVWNHSLLVLQERGLWYSFKDIPINITYPGDNFEFTIGLSIDEDIALDPETDGGLENTAYITVFFDDVIFEGEKAPGLEQVGMSLSVGNTTVYFSNTTGAGHAEILNENYWTTNPVTSILDANTSVGFEYETRLLTHHFTNSSWTTNENEIGVYYDAAFNEPVHLELFTYLGFLGEYENLTIETEHPYDWTNTTIYDPFGDDVTSLCIIGDDYVVMNSSLTSRLGWWKITLGAPNYLHANMIQVFDESQGIWINETQLRTYNSTRTRAVIGTDIEVPATLQLVNMSWISSNGSVWFSESLSDGVQGEVNGSSLIVGPQNSTAGMWYTQISWTNGTEVAFGGPHFGIYHKSNLTALDDLIYTEQDLAVRARVQFRDSENGEYIIEPTARVVGNWTTGTIEFQPNAVNNWWEYELDTTGLAGDNYTLQVNASLSYFDNSTTTMIVQVYVADNTLVLQQDAGSLDLGESFTAVLNYSDQYGVGIENANLSVRFSGPENGITWSNPAAHGAGNYSIKFNTIKSGSYTITISAIADFYESADDALFLFVDVIGTELILENGTADVISYGEAYRLVVQYRNVTGYGLENASISVASITPETGLEVSDINELGTGYYEILFKSTEADTYTILIEAALANHQTQFESFTLSVSEVSTVLTLDTSDDVITIDEYCTVYFNLINTTSDGIDGADISLLDPPSALLISETIDFDNGSYSLNITPLEIGTYQLVFRATKDNHLDSTSSFTLSVILVPTQLSVGEQDLNPVMEFGSTLDILLHYQSLYDSGEAYENITGADISLSYISGTQENIEVQIFENDENYLIRIYAIDTGSWNIRIIANITGHQEADIELSLAVVPASTEINSINPIQCYVMCTNSFLLNYSYASNGTIISEATIQPFGRAADWVEVHQLASGLFNVSLVPEETGTYQIELVASSEGHESQTLIVEFTANLRPVSIKMNTVVWKQGSSLKLSAVIVDGNDQSALVDAIVQYLIYLNGDELYSGTMDYIDNATYTASPPITWQESGNFVVEISVDKQYYESASINIDIITQPDIYAYLSGVAMAVVPSALFVVLAIGIIGAGYRHYQNKQAEHYEETRKVKRRFDDAANLLGIIVLHQKSGLPIYSRILKGGFEEGMISAFITAITHFRSEFEMSDKDYAGRVIPISDVIRAVPTNNLICAFITITSASRAQEMRMEAFAAAIGERYDGLFQDTPKEFRDQSVGTEMDLYFDKFLDGKLLKKYTLVDHDEEFKKFKSVVENARELNGEESFSLFELAHLMVENGMHEAEAYYQIFQVLTENILEPQKKLKDTTYINDLT